MTRLTVLTRAVFAALLVPAILVPGPASAGVAQADGDLSYVNPRYDDAATLAIEGTLEAVADTVPGSDQYAYAVRTDEGDAIAVPTSFGEDAPIGGRFEGEIALTGDVAQDVRAEGVTVAPGKVIDGDTAAGQTAIAVVDELEAPAPVASATVTEPVAAAATPSAHKAYVAIITNLGAVPSDNAIDDILDYWDDEAGDAISSFEVAETKQYASDAGDPGSSPLNIPTCGLDDDEWYDVWDEATEDADKFSTIDFEPGSGNHLIVLVPSSCNTSGTVGVGTVGISIADGGGSILAVTESVKQTGAHELGHNFGLGHANLEYCPSSCIVRSYYNLFNVMGFAHGNFAPPALDTTQRKFLDLADEVEQVSALGSITRELKPRAESTGLRGLRILDTDSSAEYFVDYRSGTGRDAASFYASGGAYQQFRYAPGVVVTQYTTQGPGKQTKVLTRPDGPVYRASLGQNESFTSSGGVRVAVGSVNGSSGAVVTVTLVPPLPSVIPKITPTTARVARTMTADTTGWEPGSTFTYQWRINGVPLEGVTGQTYTPARAHYKKSLSVSVTGSKAGFHDVTRTSAKSTLAAGYLIPVVPKVGGTHKVGRTLKVYPGEWAYNPKLTYRWYANGKAISNATGSTYKITSGKRGKYITVKVSASAYGFYSTSRTSARVTTVK